MRFPIFIRFLYIAFIIFLKLHAHGFCEYTPIKLYDNKNDTIISVCRRAVKGKKICVPSYDTRTHTYTTHKKVKRGGQSGVPWYVRFSCTPSYSDANNRAIVCSPTQEFYCIDTNTWIPAYKLHVGNRLLSYHGPCAITYLEHIEKELKVYALEIEPPHTFFIGHDELLTHNMALPTSWVAIAPIATFGSGAVLSVGSGAVVGATLAPFLAPVVITAGLALSSALSALVKDCSTTIPTYHAGVPTIYSFSGTNQEDQGKQNIKKESNKITNSPNRSGPKKDDDKDKEKDRKTAKMPDNEDRLGHIFKNDKGHLPRTPENYKLIEELVKNFENYLGPDGRGNHWWAKILKSGEQLWAQAYNGIVRNGGLNKIPKTYNSQTGLSKLI